MSALHPKKVKISKLEFYDGTIDLEEYLGVYKSQMYMQDVDDTTYHWYYPAILKGVAQKWFGGLQPSSIIYFYELCECFINQSIVS